MALPIRVSFRLGRAIVSRLNWRKLGRGPSLPADEPIYDADELLGNLTGERLDFGVVLADLGLS